MQVRKVPGADAGPVSVRFPVSHGTIRSGRGTGAAVRRRSMTRTAHAGYRGPVLTFLDALKRVLVGRPFRTERLRQAPLGKRLALPLLSSNALPSGA